MKKVILNEGKGYVKGTKELESDGTEICGIVGYAPKDNGHAERMNRIMKYAVRTMVLHSGASANLCA